MPKIANTQKSPFVQAKTKSQAPISQAKTSTRSQMSKEQIDTTKRLDKLERELKIAKMCLAEDMEKLKAAKQELSDCVKAAARLHIVKKNINKLQISEYHWVELISKMEEELKIYRK